MSDTAAKREEENHKGHMEKRDDDDVDSGYEEEIHQPKKEASSDQCPHTHKNQLPE